MLKAFTEPFHPRPKIDLGKNKDGGQGSKPKAKAKTGQAPLQNMDLSRPPQRQARTRAADGVDQLGPCIARSYLLGVGVDRFLDDVRNPDSSIDAAWLYFLVGLAAVYVLQALTAWLHNVWMIGIAQRRCTGCGWICSRICTGFRSRSTASASRARS